MVSSDGAKIQAQISFVKGAWVVTIYNRDHTENRSFLNEIDARDYGKARLDQLLSGGGDIRIDTDLS